jgi:hypothetical protein
MATSLLRRRFPEFDRLGNPNILTGRDGSIPGMAAVFIWLNWELRQRNPGEKKETVYLCDGQESKKKGPPGNWRLLGA